MSDPSASIALVRRSMLEGFNQKSAAALDSTISDTYVQHNPGGSDGRKGLDAMLQYVSPQIEIVRSIAEGDFVVNHHRSTGWGDGKSYVSFDIFRVKDGKVVEHWDVMQELVSKTVSGRTQTDGPTEVMDSALTLANKAVVQAFLDDCAYGNNWQNLPKYFSAERYDQHNPSVPDGLTGFTEAMKHLAAQGLTMRFDKTYRVVAQGNFVFVHSRGEFAGKSVAFADLMRVEGGKIVEHWDAIQPIGPANKSGHDLFEQVTR